MTGNATEPLRVAVIGIGGIGAAHLRCARTTDATNLVCACDLDQHHLDHLHVADPALSLTTDWRIVRDRDDLDAVIVALPHHLYVDAVPSLLEAGHNVLMEKPFGRNLDEAHTMVDAAKKAGRVLMVCGQNKFSPAFARSRRIISDGVIGDVSLIRGTSVYRWGNSRDWGWRGNRAQSGGAALLDAGWHILEQITELHGVPEAVFAASGTKKAAPSVDYDVEDNALLVLLYPDGSVGQVLSTFVTTPFEWRILAHGAAGSVELTRQVRLELGEGPPTVEQFDETDIMQAQLEHFVGAVERGDRYRGTPEDGLSLMRVIDAAYRSMESRRAEAVES
jgi:predicted dehydrogenase